MKLMTWHAMRRSQQRATSEAAIEATMAYGVEIRQSGRTAFYLGWRQVRAVARQGVDLLPYEGTAVVVADDGAIITVIRCSDTRKLRQIAEYRRCA
jgi:hypothetical protein